VVTSRPGQGTQVWLSVPIADEKVHGTTARLAETQRGAAPPLGDSVLSRVSTRSGD
jgi:hypothetical protein